MSRHCSLEVLSSFVDRELEKAKQKWVEEHVSRCTECSDRLAGLAQVVRQLQRLEGVSPPPTLGLRLERRIRLERRKKGLATLLEKEAGRWLKQPVLAPLFAIVLALGIILYLFAVGVGHQEARTTRLVIAEGTEEIPFEEGEGQGAEVPEKVLEDRLQGGRSLEDEEAVASSSIELPEGRERARGFRAPAADSTVSGAVRTMVVAGRTFDLERGIWRERSLPSGAPEETIDLRNGGSKPDRLPSELEGLRMLEGRVHLLVEGRVVELILPGEDAALLSREGE
jgi:hypothetical protein